MRWFADRFDMVLNGSPDWLSGLRTNDTSSPVIWTGPYASSQEVNLYFSGQPNLSYDQRLLDTAGHWLYIYAKAYMESKGISPESLVVHVADDFVSLGLSDGQRDIQDLGSLPLYKRRFTYQYWNNSSGDYFYPAGYIWLANGWNRDTREAIADAYYRAFVANPQKLGWPAQRWDCFYMDNQYREGSLLASYWSLKGSSGGPSPDSLDWMERSGVRSNTGGSSSEIRHDYFDNSTLKIDSAILSKLSTYDVKPFANCDGGDYIGVSKILPNVSGVTFESPVDYTKSWAAWNNWLTTADTMANHLDKYCFWELRQDFLCSSDPGNWRFDSSRVFLTGYAFYLIVRDTNAFFGPHEVHQGDGDGIHRAWRDIYEVDLGEADSSYRKLDSAGSGPWDSKNMVLYRSYGPNAVLLRTGYANANFTGDSMAVNLHNLYFEIDADADTSTIADSVFYLKPYMGKILMAASACGVPPSAPVEASPAPGSSVGTNPTLCVGNSNHGSCPDAVTYQFQIAEDATFATVVRESGWLSEGASTTCFTTSAALDEGRRYYWRCRATNGTATSRWSDGSNFTTPNSPPPTPTGDSPADQGKVYTQQPVLSINTIVDPDGTPVTYTFQVSKISNFSSVAAQSGQVPEGSGKTSWQVTPALENGSAYFWRARAYDGIAYSNWTTSRSFTVSATTTNHAPTAPTVYSPPNGATVTFVPMSLSWYNSTDADGDPITYHLELYDSAAVTRIDSASGISQGSGATSSYSPQVTLTNAEWYSWKVRAFDGTDYSPWMTTVRFYLDTMYGVNQPPEAPGLVSPLDFDTLITLQVSLVVAQSFDPEMDPLTYEFALYNDQAMENLVDSASGLTAFGSGDNVIWPVSATLISGARYFWTCRAFDGEN